MRYKFLFVFLLVTVFSQAQSQDNIKQGARRPKIGLVLSGGGAKGFAHIGVLKVLEEMGIPIDYISGTSMGSIIGGLYAIGYSAKEIEDMVLKQDWERVLTDKVDRWNVPIHEKEDMERYVLSFPIKPKGIQLPSGIVEGQNIVNLFSRLSLPYHGETDFRKFPIPFVCVAADIETGDEVVLDKGYLPLAMRASMAIPTVFTPVEIGGRLLVDGGMVNNFPVDEVVKMGADLVIGVDVASAPRKKEDLKSIHDIINQTISLMGKQEFVRNKELCDIYIKPELEGYSVSSFGSADSLMKHGERMARTFIPLLEALKKKFKLTSKKRNGLVTPSDTDSLFVKRISISGLDDVKRSLVLGKLNLEIPDTITLGQLQKGIDRVYGSRYFNRVNYRVEGEKEKSLHLFMKERITNRFNVGIHYDDDNRASVLLNTTFMNKLRSGTRLSLDLKLSENPRFVSTYNIDNGLKPGYRLRFEVNDADVFRYEDGKKVASYNYTSSKLDVNTHSIFKDSYSLGFGGRLEYYRVKSDVANENFRLNQNNFYISYFAFLKMNTYDKGNYPCQGVSLYGEYKLVTDNGFKNGSSNAPASVAFLKVKRAFSFNSWLTFYPGFYGRIVWGKDIPIEYYTHVGGVDQTDYFDIQVPFIGLRRMEVMTKNAFVVKGDLQFQLFRNNYLIIKTNIGHYMDNAKDIFEGGEWIHGGGITYSYNSLIGPMEVSLMISNNHKKISNFVSLGYWF